MTISQSLEHSWIKVRWGLLPLRDGSCDKPSASREGPRVVPWAVGSEVLPEMVSEPSHRGIRWHPWSLYACSRAPSHRNF